MNERQSLSASLRSGQWIAGVYIMQGLPFALVASVSPVLYKEYGFANAEIAFITSLFTLPWVCKFLFAPALERMASRRAFTIAAQLAMFALILLLAFTLYMTNNIYLSGAVFMLIALTGAIHDINSDGLYLLNLDLHDQASLIGVRTIFYQLGKLLCQSGLVYAAGLLTFWVVHVPIWPSVLILLALIVCMFSLYNYKYIPVAEVANDQKPFTASYKKVLLELYQLPHLIAVIIFLLLYNLPESQLIKILPLLMLDQAQNGGLNLSVSDVGIINGVSLVSLLAGVTLSGYIMNRSGLKKCLLPFTVLAALANISYLTLIYWHHGIWSVNAVVAVAQFFYGLSNGAYMLYLITLFAKGKCSMSLYAIGTAIMLLGMMLAGGVSGYIQAMLGYPGFFIWVVCASIGLIFLAHYHAKEIV
jgi:PAT family beta-lactamase induction signal transducer AmpG